MYTPESELIGQLRRGEQEGYRQLFLRYHMRVLLFVKGFVKTGALSEDIAQNVFMKLWIMRETLSGVSLNNLLFTIARNEVRDYFRSHYYSRREALQEGDTLADSDGDDIVETLHAALVDEIIDRSIDRLSDRRKEIFRLSRQENLTNQEIATLLGLSVRTVEKSLEMAIRQLRNDISRIN